ncbi:MAG TPA: hypothetical protein VF085_03300, partial [Solirubrobacterales bacterium]
KRIALLGGTILASIVLFGALASSASAMKPVGFFLAGEKSEEKAKQPRFEAESYPVTLRGTQNTAHVFTSQIGSWSCNTAEFFGEQSSATAEQWLWMSYFQCTPPFGSGSISPNGCEYKLHVANSGPPYTGQLEVVCPKEKSYELSFTSGAVTCTMAIPAQTGLNGVSFKNTGTGSARAVEVSFNVTGLKYSLKGPPLLCKAGAYENGTYTGTMTLHGSDE